MKHSAHPRHARGFVLIEVMVALLIFMLGVLGMIGLQAALTRAASDSKVRADASYLASEMVGRLWSDMKNLSAYNSCASTALCKEWQSKVAASLPNGTGDVSVTINGSDAAVTITIGWTGPDQQPHQYVTSTNIVPNS
ncbi:prepilin-type N-terminal cleavage/methylation domain-containing protein [Roseateles sp. BYS78W]|uniref:Prepilin-type N-terminal cleavage/methylation domain-containing protein n=1 Tax=Pelomonas candidula TaxID=3299025 RepID=A0ABW7HHJ2_9BURK